MGAVRGAGRRAGVLGLGSRCCLFDGLCPALLRATPEIRLGAGHWVLGRPALSDRQIPLKNSARQCSSYFQIACAKNTCETALLEIGKTWGLQLCSATPRRGAHCGARDRNKEAPARARLDSAARPRVWFTRRVRRPPAVSSASSTHSTRDGAGARTRRDGRPRAGPAEE